MSQRPVVLALEDGERDRTIADWFIRSARSGRRIDLPNDRRATALLAFDLPYARHGELAGGLWRLDPDEITPPLDCAPYLPDRVRAALEAVMREFPPTVGERAVRLAERMGEWLTVKASPAYAESRKVEAERLAAAQEREEEAKRARMALDAATPRPRRARIAEGVDYNLFDDDKCR